jgi:hypothetical protein
MLGECVHTQKTAAREYGHFMECKGYVCNSRGHF